jgi:HEAT repeat protein
MKNFVGAGLLLLMIFGISESGGGKAKKEDIPKYLHMLTRSINPKERALGAEMLGKRGEINVKDVQDAIEPLKLALQKDSDMDVRRASAEALGRIGPDPETTIPLLIDSVKNNKNYGLRIAAVHALAAYGNKAKPAIPVLKELRKELANKKDDKIIGAAMQSINKKG